MNCYDCAGDGRTTPAVGICTNCGAALCGDHARLETQDHGLAATTAPAHSSAPVATSSSASPLPDLTETGDGRIGQRATRERHSHSVG
jgi:hypothetical protein